jgi:hypothetical protein
MATPSTPLIDADHAAFIEGPVSISIGSCNAYLSPSLTRGIGCKVSADRQFVTIFVAQSHSQQFLRDLQDKGAVAVALTRPTTHRTMQLKSEHAEVLPLEEGDFARIETYRHAFITEVAPLGYEFAMLRAFVDCAQHDLVAVRFAPTAAFTQTPGPQAGQPLKAAM